MDNFFNIDNKSGIIGKIKLVMLVLFFTLICIEVSANINYQVSCDFDSQDLRFVLKDLAGQAKANIVIDDNLQRRVTLNLENVPFIDALEMLEQAFSLDVVINNEIIIVTQRSQYNTSYNQTNSEASSSEIIQLNSKTPNEIIEVIKAISNELTIVVFEEQDILVVSGPYSKVNLAKNAISSWYNKPKQDELIKSVAIKLNYIDTQDLSYLSGLSSGVRILALNNINTVIVTGSESGVANTVQLIQTLDKPPKVVQISVEMLEVKQGDLENIGVSLKSSSGYNSLAIKWDEQNFQQNPWSGKDEKEEVDLLDFIKLRPLVRASQVRFVKR